MNLIIVIILFIMERRKRNHEAMTIRKLLFNPKATGLFYLIGKHISKKFTTPYLFILRQTSVINSFDIN